MKIVKFLTALVMMSFALMANAKNVILHTNYGDIKIALEEEKAPVSAKNFLEYSQSGFYNGTIFHRVIPGFMI